MEAVLNTGESLTMSMSGRVASNSASFGELLRQWRRARNLSQLSLAVDAEVSSRHISFMETGRTTPSREMVLRIGAVLDLPLRDRNALLNSAGYAALYRETGLESGEMEIAREALERILAQQEPYPALVMNADWDFVMANSGVQRISDLILGDDPEAQGFTNALHLLFSPKGLQPFVSNWHEVASVLLSRVQRESAGRPGGQSPLLQALLRYPTVPENWHLRAAVQSGAPVLELALEKDDVRLRFFTILATFGTPQDVTLQELRIECYFPSDDATRRFFAAL